MKFLHLLICVLLLQNSFAIPELKPFAEKSKSFVEFLVDSGVLKSGKAVSGVLKGLSVAVPVLAVVDVGLNVFLPSEMEILKEKLDDIERKMDEHHREILNGFDNLEKILERSFATITKEIFIIELIRLQSNIKTQYDEFQSIFTAYASNETELAYHLNNFLSNYREKNYEINIVNYLIQNTAGESPLIKLYKSAIKDSENLFNPVKSSPNQVMLDLYFSLLTTIYKGSALLSFSYSLKDKILQNNSENDQTYIITKTNTAVNRLNEAFKSLITENYDKFLTTFHDFRPENNQKVISIAAAHHEKHHENPDLVWFGIGTYVYTGKIMAEKEGYVITGVRLRNEKRNVNSLGSSVTYLQIQIGQLLSNGYVNSSTIYWQQSPTDFELSNLELAFYLNLNELNFNDSFLTGVQFIKEGVEDKFEIYIGLRIFGRKNENEKLGEEKQIETKLNLDSNKLDMYFKGHGLNGDKLKNPMDYLIFNHSYYINLWERVGSWTFENKLNVFKIFFSTEDVTLDYPMALSGLGLMDFTNAEGYSGYVKPYLKTMHMNSFM